MDDIFGYGTMLTGMNPAQSSGRQAKMMTEEKTKLNFAFREELNSIAEGFRHNYCYQCGACVADCPACNYSDTFNPRLIILKALLGFREELISIDSDIWSCTNCYTCSERCPQDVRPVDVIIALKNICVRDGCAPGLINEVSGSVLESGMTTKVTSANTRSRTSGDCSKMTDKKYAPFFGCMMTTKYPWFEAVVRRTLERVGLELVDVEGFTCCPDPIYFQARDKLQWYTVAARNLTLAEEKGHDVITTCSGCTATLSEVNLALKEDPALKDRINERLSRVGREFKGTIDVRHAVTVVRDDFGLDRVTETVVRPLEGLKVAIHYGCHLLKPSRVMRVDDPDRPTILDRLIRAIGAEPLHHPRTLLCCGRACIDDDIPDRMVGDILDAVKDSGADCMGLICPSCFDEFDLGQIVLGRKLKKTFNVPIIYYFQLLGLAQGMNLQEVGLHRHKVKFDNILEPAGA